MQIHAHLQDGTQATDSGLFVGCQATHDLPAPDLEVNVWDPCHLKCLRKIRSRSFVNEFETRVLRDAY